jgi:hypothetical protein
MVSGLPLLRHPQPARQPACQPSVCRWLANGGGLEINNFIYIFAPDISSQITTNRCAPVVPREVGRFFRDISARIQSKHPPRVRRGPHFPSSNARSGWNETSPLFDSTPKYPTASSTTQTKTTFPNTNKIFPKISPPHSHCLRRVYAFVGPNRLPHDPSLFYRFVHMQKAYIPCVDRVRAQTYQFVRST